MKIISKCRICGNKDLIPIIDLGVQKLSGIFPHPNDPQPSESQLELIRCNNLLGENNCGLVQLNHKANVDEMYGASYGYYSSISPTMISHLKTIGDRLMNFVDLGKEDIVLDIGCNDGTLLNHFKGLDLIRVGIDPSSKKFSSNFQDDILVSYELFTEKKVREIINDKKCRLITSIAMFYDIEDPLDFMKQIKSLLDEEGVWALELSYLPLLLSNLTYDQICHEHVTYFAIKHFDYMAKKLGLRILDVDFNYMNGGSFFVIISHENHPFKQNDEKVKKLMNDEKFLEDPLTFDRFRKRVVNHRSEVRQFFSLINNSEKKILGYGASTKGNIILNYCGLDTSHLPAISDRNPEKYGLTTPGTKIPIISHDEMRKNYPDYLFVTIWHFRKEVIMDEIEFLERGGKLVFILPRIHIVNIENFELYLNTDFDVLSYLI